MEIGTCGINLAKNVVCTPWSRHSWSNQFAQALAPARNGSVLCKKGTLPYRNGSLCQYRYRAHKLIEPGHGETDRFYGIGRDRYILRVKGVQ